MLLLADAAYATLRTGLVLGEQRARLAAAADALQQRDLGRAGAGFRAVARATDPLPGLAAHPGTVLVGHLPVVGADVRALVALGRAAHLAARGGAELVAAARTLGAGRGPLAGAVLEGGRIRLAAVQDAIPHVRGAAQDLSRARRLLDAAPRPHAGPLASAVAQGRSGIGPAAVATRKADALLGALPALLGADGRRRYLLVFQSPGEVRGTGGLVGVYGTLEARNGRFRLTQVAPIVRLIDRHTGSIDAPTWFERHYASLGALRQWQQVNLSAQFPTVAAAMLRMYRADTGQRLDGVIAMDPLVLGDLLPAIGPLPGEPLARHLTEANATRVLLRDSYVHFRGSGDEQRQSRYVAGVVRDFWDRVAGGDVDDVALSRGLAEAAANRHLVVFARDRRIEAKLRRAGVGGDLRTAGRNLQMVFADSHSLSKVDYFMHRTIDTRVLLQPSGDAVVTTTVELHNAAPGGPPSILLGAPTRSKHGGVGPGNNLMLLNLVLPDNARVRSFALDGTRSSYLSDPEAGYPDVWNPVFVPAGATRTVKVTYTIPHAVTEGPHGPAFELSLVPQATVHPDRYRLVVRSPFGYRIVGADGARHSTGEASASGILDRAVRVVLSLSKD